MRRIVVALLLAGLVTVGAAGANRSADWTPLPKAPIVGRIGAGTVWTGREMIVWGGLARTGSIRMVSDGAAYDPVTRTWRKLHAPPAGVTGIAEAAVWTGTKAVFWAGNSPDGPAAGGVYDPRSDRWQRLPRGPLSVRESYWSTWTGKELLIVGGTAGDGFASPVAAAVDPATGRWRLLKGLNHYPGLLIYGGFWTGREVVLLGSHCTTPERGSACATYRQMVIAYDPASDAVRNLDLSHAPRHGRSGLIGIAWYAHEALFLLSPTNKVVAYDASTGRWRYGKAAPCAIADDGYSQSAWLGDRYATACGKTAVQIYVPRTNSWRVVRARRSPFTTRSGSAIAWTGRELIAWSGTSPLRGNPTPPDGASLVLPR